MAEFKEVIQRTKGKLNSDIGIGDFYEEYKREGEVKKRNIVNYSIYSNILKDFNKELSKRIVYNCQTYHLPYKLGLLGVIKFEQSFSEDNKHKWAVNWKKSKEIGQIVYFENSERYKWKWDKHQTLKGKRYYQFKANQPNSRLIKKALTDNPFVLPYKHLFLFYHVYIQSYLI